MDSAILHRRSQERTVRLPTSVEELSASAVGRAVMPSLRRALGLEFLDRTADRALRMFAPDAGPGERFARAMDVTLDVAEADFARIPKSGPLVVTANHPFGFLDAACVCWILDRARPDVRILANRMLETSTLARGKCFFVDIFGGDRAANARALRDSIEWVRGGGCLAIFPAGQVAASPRPGMPAEESQWSPLVGRLVEKSRATVLPLWVHGTNSVVFNRAGTIHPFLRTALLPHELRRRAGTAVRISVGIPAAPQTWAPHAESGKLVEFMRARAELAGTEAQATITQPAQAKAPRREEPIPAGSDAWRGELVAAASAQELCAHGPFRVLAVRGAEIPETLREIGRLREITFRAVGEGSGNAIDIDRFDGHYWQLVMMDAQAGTIIGGYRLGVTSEILPKHGVDGMYTHTLFDYSEQLLRAMGPAVEMGRSYVVPERQREAIPLHLLWRGIGEFAVRNPDLGNLFGPVSIPADFSTVSKELMTTFLAENRLDATLARLVTARTPPVRGATVPRPEVLRSVARSIEEVDELVAALEGGRGVPPLLRHYLRLDARVLAFNVDRSFGDCLDALITVHLPSVSPRILSKYLAKGMDGYLAHHGVVTRAAG